MLVRNYSSLIYACSAVNFPFSLALAVYHKFYFPFHSLQYIFLNFSWYFYFCLCSFVVVSLFFLHNGDLFFRVAFLFICSFLSLMSYSFFHGFLIYIIWVSLIMVYWCLILLIQVKYSNLTSIYIPMLTAIYNIIVLNISSSYI